MFQVPDSTSPPSTPNTKSPNPHKLNRHGFSNPSTTPAAPPPNSLAAASTTPAGPPPSSLFGSSQKAGAPIPFPVARAFNKKPVTKSPLEGFQSLKQDDPSRDDETLDEDECMEYEDDDSLRFGATNGAVTKPPNKFNIHEVALGLAQPSAGLHEDDNVVLRTEQVIESVSSTDQARSASLLPNAVQELILVWLADLDRHVFGEYGIGPGQSASAQLKAAYVSSFLFTLHHPPRKSHSRSRFGLGDPEKNSKPLTEALLDWLREYHFASLLEGDEILNHQPNCAAHGRFWDTLFILAVRGEIGLVIQLLREADYAQAASALQDGAPEPGYQGRQLGNVQRIVGTAVQVLQSCPGLASGDWNVINADWAAFRRRVEQALADLDTFAEGTGTGFGGGQSHFSKMSSIASEEGLPMPRSPRVESKVPWTIYQNLGYLYRQILGVKSEVLAASGDWLEAVIGMTVWCQDVDEGNGRADLLPSRRMHAANPQATFQQKLQRSIQELANRTPDSAEDADMAINPADAVEVSLACVCAGDFEGLFGILRGWSATISTAVVEVADAGRWLISDQPPSNGLFDGFSDDDLMVLSYAKEQSSPVNKDEILGQYSGLLRQRSRYHDGLTGKHSSGWQLAVQVIARMDNREDATARIGDILDQEPCTSSSQVDRTVSLLDRIGFSDLSRRISLQYADHLMQSTRNYGEAIIHYAQANDIPKMKQVLDLLTSMSLVQSIAYPPSSELDDYTRSLLSTPKELVSRVDRLDADAGQALLRCVSGYATIRSFYESRDHEILAREQYKQPNLRPLQRKREAGGALVAAIMSAADGIHGGLYDDNVQSAMQVDGLLVLLGEALVFINQPQPILTPGQTFAILKAVEDLSTVSSSIRAQCEECFKSAMASFYGSEPPSPRSMMKKSMSRSMMESSVFSLIGSEMLQPQARSKESSDDSSGVLVNGHAKRAWDWRRGLDKSAKGEEVLRILRLGLAKEVSRSWVESRGRE